MPSPDPRRSTRVAPAESSPASRAEDWLALAWAHYEAGRLDDAIGAVRRPDALPRADSDAALGWFLLEKGQIREAERVLREALARDPTFPPLYWYLGLLRRRQNRLPAARRALERALELDPTLDEAAVSLAWVLHDLGRFGEAIVWSKRALATRKQTDRQAQLGWLLLCEKQFDEAVSQLRAALAGSPASVQIRANLARALRGLGRHDRARAVLEEGLVRAPDGAELLSALGWLLREEQDLAAAEVVAERLTRAHPGLADGWQLLGSVADNLGQADRAERCLSTALSRNEMQPDTRLREAVERAVLSLKVHVLLKLQRVAEARALAHRLIRQQPRDGTHWQTLAQVLLRRGRRNLAGLALRRACRLLPAHADVWRQRGWLALETGDLRGARQAVGRAQALAPENAENRLLAASVMAAGGDLEAAARQAEQAVAGAEHSAAAWRTLAHVRSRQGRLDEAELALRIALDRDPEDRDALRQLGWLCLAGQRAKEAIAAFRRALKGDARDAASWFGLAEACRAAGRHIEALRAVKGTTQPYDNWTEAGLLRSRIVSDQVFTLMQRNWQNLDATPQYPGYAPRAVTKSGTNKRERAKASVRDGDPATGADYEFVLCSLSTKSHLPLMRTLAESARRHFAGRICLLLIDSDDASLLPDGTTLVRLRDVIDPAAWREMAARYNVLEQCCALKPFLMRYLARKEKRPVIYLDADAYLLAPLQPLLPRRSDFSVFLTPHLLYPLSGDRHAEEIGILRVGAYNAGMVGVGSGREGARFLDWWADRAFRYAYELREQGIFTDQRWLDFVPSFFQGVVISRNAGLNVGHWRVCSTRDFAEDDHARLTFCGEPVTLMHVSGFEAERPDRLAQHLGPPVRARSALGKFLRTYAREVIRNRRGRETSKRRS